MKKACTHCLLILLVLLTVVGCAHHLPVAPETRPEVYAPADWQQNPLAPLFLAYGSRKGRNRIGRPTARVRAEGRTDVFVDAGHPAVYTRRLPFVTAHGRYVNHIYRVHFADIPFSLVPFNLAAGKNVGLIVIITADESGRPLLVTSVQTCGCYHAIVPTDYLPRDAYPAGYSRKAQWVFGEKLPWRLTYRGVQRPRLLVSLRPDVHRVMHLEVVDARRVPAAYRVIPMPVEDLSALEHLKAGGGSTSFYYSSGLLKDFVKGSVKPWESLLLSLPSLDLFVGTDKVYDPARPTPNRFYTSLVPWRQKASDMRHFAAFLKFWGWGL